MSTTLSIQLHSTQQLTTTVVEGDNNYKISGNLSLLTNHTHLIWKVISNIVWFLWHLCCGTETHYHTWHFSGTVMCPMSVLSMQNRHQNEMKRGHSQGRQCITAYTGCGNEKDPTTKMQYLWNGTRVVNKNFLGDWRCNLTQTAEMLRVMVPEVSF